MKTNTNRNRSLPAGKGSMRALLLTLLLTLGLGTALAKDIQTLVVTTTPLMHCDNCEKKIKGNLRFEKGVTRIQTSIEQQRVTITYDADKTTPDRIVAAFGKFGYKAQAVKTEPAKTPAAK